MSDEFPSVCCKHCGSFLDNGDLDENGRPYCDCEGAHIERLEAENEKLQQILWDIKEVCERIPPYYAYGDSEAGVYMGDMINEIAQMCCI